MSFKKYASDDDSAGGVWRTIGGRRIFIKDGEGLASAMKASGKFKTGSGAKNKYKGISEKTKNEALDKIKKRVENFKWTDEDEKKVQEDLVIEYKKLKEVQSKMDELDHKLAEYEDDEFVKDSPAHDELKWEYEKAKEEYEKLRKGTRNQRRLEDGKEIHEVFRQMDDREIEARYGREFSVHDNYIRTIAPYDETDYAYAYKKDDKWIVRNPIKNEYNEKAFISQEKALEEMESINKHIRTGDKVKSYEGITKYRQNNVRKEYENNQTKKSYEETINEVKRKQAVENVKKGLPYVDDKTAKNYVEKLEKSISALSRIDKIAGNDERLQKLGREMGANSFEKWLNAYNEYKKEHPNSKIDLYKFIKMNKD